MYDIVGELGHVERLQRETAATLRETADWTTLAATLDAAVLAPRFEMLEAEHDPVTRVRYLELRSLDVHLRDRIRAVGDAATGLGRLAQRLVADVEQLDREIALWPERAARSSLT